MCYSRVFIDVIAHRIYMKELIGRIRTSLNLLPQHDQLEYHFLLLLELPVLETLLQLFLPLDLNAFIELAFHFCNHIRDVSSITQSHRLSVKITTLQLFYCLLGLIFLGADDEGLATHFYILFCVHFQNVNADI